MSSRNVIAGRYEVIKHIGQGGMADVFLAIDTILNRRVAIKILRADLSSDTVSILRFEREAQAATALSHPNIVEIYDVGEYKNHHYIVMEFVPGKTLKQVIKDRGPLLVEEAVDIMKQLTSAVAEAHSRGIIHRDIKPQNVIVKADGSVKILDFGIAMAKGSAQLTQANNVMGSVHYLAPELAKGEQASAQSDIYALGVVLYEMLAKDVPFKADQAIQVAMMHMREPFPSIRDINSSVPQSVENIITRAVAKNPNDRYRSCDEMLRDLRTCLRPERLNEPKLVIENRPVTNSTQKRKTKPQETHEKAVITKRDRSREEEKRKERILAEQKAAKRKKRLIVILILIVVLIAAVGGYLLFQSSRPVQVPDLVGLTVDEAESVLEESNLVLDTDNITYELTADTEEGEIISSSPESGTSVDKESTVTVIVSSGIGNVIADYTGQNIQDVETAIASAYPNLRVIAESVSSDEEPGTILSQSGLEAGTLYDASTAGTIQFTYSEYSTIYIPEDILGMDINEAVAELESLGVSVRTSNRDTTQMSQDELEEITIGVVIESNPAAGTEYTQREDNYVTLYYY